MWWSTLWSITLHLSLLGIWRIMLISSSLMMDPFKWFSLEALLCLWIFRRILLCILERRARIVLSLWRMPVWVPSLILFADWSIFVMFLMAFPFKSKLFFVLLDFMTLWSIRSSNYSLFCFLRFVLLFTKNKCGLKEEIWMNGRF